MLEYQATKGFLECNQDKSKTLILVTNGCTGLWKWQPLAILLVGIDLKLKCVVETKFIRSSHRRISHEFTLSHLKPLHISNKTEHCSYKDVCGIHGCTCIDTFERQDIRENKASISLLSHDLTWTTVIHVTRWLRRYLIELSV